MTNTFEDYTSTKGLNWSTLKHLHTSPRLLKLRAETPEQDKPAYKMGRAIHTAVLEPERYPSAYLTQPDFGNLRTKAGKDARDSWLSDLRPGTETLSQSEHDLCVTARLVTHSHKAAAELLAVGRPEVTAQWEQDGVACKCRIDWLRPNGIADLKTTRCRNLGEFARDCAKFLYHGQVVWYHRGAIAAGLIPADADMPRIIAVQTVEPHDVWVLRVAGLAISAGRRLCDSLLAKYKACQVANYWPGIAPDEVDLDLPTWAAGVADDDEEGWT